MEERLFCKGGGCTAKLGPGMLSHILDKLPQNQMDENLLIGFHSKDDSAVYRLTDEMAIVSTLDFFPPMVEDPYTFGEIAAANALSDIYAMGAEVKTALNIVCFPESMDLNILGSIMTGGANKVREAGGCLAGGHSITDTEVKYGLAVTGVVHPQKILSNTGGQIADQLILTKKLGVGILSAAHRVKAASPAGMAEAIASMTRLNKYAAECLKGYEVHACTDITGFGFLGHLHEMMGGQLACVIDSSKIPYFAEARDHAGEFLLTAAAQRNRNHVSSYVSFQGIAFEMEEILFDPQTSGGLLLAVAPKDAESLLNSLKSGGIHAALVGEITAPKNSVPQITVI